MPTPGTFLDESDPAPRERPGRGAPPPSLVAEDLLDFAAQYGREEALAGRALGAVVLSAKSLSHKRFGQASPKWRGITLVRIKASFSASKMSVDTTSRLR